MALCGEIVYFCRPYFSYDTKDAHGVTKVGIVEMEVGRTLKMSYALAIVY